jgi:phage terminase small subunit
MKKYKLSERQIKFIQDYTNGSGNNFSNAYRSALKAGYSDSYAKKITSYIGWQELEERLKKISEKVGKGRIFGV